MADVRPIDANALPMYKVKIVHAFGIVEGSVVFPDDIKNAPTIDAVPVVHGRWVRAAGKSNIWYCSVCGDKINYKQNRRTYNIPVVPVEQKNKFCRNCGAKMDGGADT